MKIYLAGNTAVVEREQKLAELYEQRLCSYFHIVPGQIEHKSFQWIIENANIHGRSPRRR